MGSGLNNCIIWASYAIIQAWPQNITALFLPYNFLFTIFPRVANVYWHLLTSFLTEKKGNLTGAGSYNPGEWLPVFTSSFAGRAVKDTMG